MLRSLRLAAFAVAALDLDRRVGRLGAEEADRDAAVDAGRIDRHRRAQAAGRHVEEERLGGGQAGRQIDAEAEIEVQAGRDADRRRRIEADAKLLGLGAQVRQRATVVSVATKSRENTRSVLLLVKVCDTVLGATVAVRSPI